MFIAIIASLVALGSGVVLLTASAWLITSAAFHPPLSELALGITAVRAAGIARAAFRYIERLFTHSAALDKLVDIRVNLYKMALSVLPLKSGASRQGEFLHKLSVQADTQKDFLPRVVIPIVGSITLTLASTAIIARSIGIVSVIIPTALLVTVMIAWIVDEIAINDAEYRQSLLDFNGGRDEITIADSFDRVRSILDRQADQLSNVERTRIINVDSIIAIINAAMLCIVIQELSTRLDVISLAVNTFLMLATIEVISTVPSAVRLGKKIRAKSETKFVGVHKIVEREESSSTLGEKMLSLDGVKFELEGRAVLDGVNLQLLRAERIAIMGESGAGKTTLLRLMTGLWTPDAGSLEGRGRVSAATSVNYIFAASIRENFRMLLPDADETTMLESLRLAQLDEIDLDAELGVDGGRLSGGQRCRLQTALALASGADVVILDEPTAGLDRSTADRLIGTVLEWAAQTERALIVMTHDPKVAARFERVYKLENGRLISFVGRK